MLTLPDAIVSMLVPFATLFTSPTWRKAQLLLVGAILTPGQRTVAAALRVMGRSDQRDYARYHEVLNRAVWSSRQAARILLVLLLQHLDRGDGPLIFGIDETLERRRGAKIRARAIYVSSSIKMCKSSKMELTHPRVVASSADNPWRCVTQIAKGGTSERDLRDERSRPFDPGDCPEVGGVAQHGAAVFEDAGGDAAQAAAASGLEAGFVHRAH